MFVGVDVGRGVGVLVGATVGKGVDVRVTVGDGDEPRSEHPTTAVKNASSAQEISRDMARPVIAAGLFWSPSIVGVFYHTTHLRSQYSVSHHTGQLGDLNWRHDPINRSSWSRHPEFLRSVCGDCAAVNDV